MVWRGCFEVWLFCGWLWGKIGKGGKRFVEDWEGKGGIVVLNLMILLLGLEWNGDWFWYDFEGMGKYYGDGCLICLVMFMVFWLSVRVYLV